MKNQARSEVSHISNVELHAKQLSAFNKIDRSQLESSAKILLSAIGEVSGREGLKNTPERFAKAYAHLCAGYQMTGEQVVGEGIFAAEGSGLVSIRNVEFFSMCEHHVLPFWGKASVAYLPGRKILGLSKIPRIVDLFARRLQVQERLTENIAAELERLIQPRAVVVRIEAQHLCMMMRGVEKQHSNTVTETCRNSSKISADEIQRLYMAAHIGQ
jgi:GTP cyclohydrolase IA